MTFPSDCPAGPETLVKMTVFDAKDKTQEPVSTELLCYCKKCLKKNTQYKINPLSEDMFAGPHSPHQLDEFNPQIQNADDDKSPSSKTSKFDFVCDVNIRDVTSAVLAAARWHRVCCRLPTHSQQEQINRAGLYLPSSTRHPLCHQSCC